MENREKSQSIKDEVKGYITLSGWQMGDVAKKISKRNSKVPLQNLSNKLTNGTIKYSEVSRCDWIWNYMEKEIGGIKNGCEEKRFIQ